MNQEAAKEEKKNWLVGETATAGTMYRTARLDMTRFFRLEKASLPTLLNEDEESMVRLVDSILREALQSEASDIHVEIHKDKTTVRYRIDGILQDGMTLPPMLHGTLLSRIKVLAQMDIAQKRIPQDGRIQIEDQGKAIDLRVATLPTIFGENCTIRILDKEKAPISLEDLCFQEKVLPLYKKMIQHSYGMILLTGPTGSGKTTTLYSSLYCLNHREQKIVTIEDPVEYVLDGVSQIQVNSKAGLTFPWALRSILRQDPDVIMVGEIRDQETADIAVGAAITGHLVLSTLHTGDAAGAVTRLIDMGLEPYRVASSVIGIVAQRLVRKICDHCKSSYTPEQDALERFFLQVEPKKDVTLFKGLGCSACNQTGYKGRIAIHEVLPIKTEERQLIMNKASVEAIRQSATRGGMITLREDGIYKALQGYTTIQEVMRVAYRID
ncbi:GspE/PulE family protein [Heliorestis convoluta]|uniref:Type II secretion system protein GspE n=1 Tax=Heliorestis convoluta TaxID=356322 RepID=A0A5Q2N118_9FIRM|nr:GspE/PulE family protein [Heliorestis convoluta]QGG49054.1 type II secretion system protein GspE [Heliorestis convoluta]